MKKIIGGWLPVLFAAVMLISACSPDKKPLAARPAPVDVAVAANKAVPVRLHALGAVEAYQTISVRSQVTAQIRKVLFKEGQDVKAGDLLIELDCRTYEAELQKAEADLARDRAQARFAGIQSRRYSDLVKKDYVAREQYDQLQANHEALEATVKADEAFVESSRVQIRYCSIFSPVDGRAGMQKVSSGNIVRANDTEILTIHQIQPVKVSFAIPENDLPEVRKYFPGKRSKQMPFSPGKNGPKRESSSPWTMPSAGRPGPLCSKPCLQTRISVLCPDSSSMWSLRSPPSPTSCLSPPGAWSRGRGAGMSLWSGLT